MRAAGVVGVRELRGVGYWSEIKVDVLNVASNQPARLSDKHGQ